MKREFVHDSAGHPAIRFRVVDTSFGKILLARSDRGLYRLNFQDGTDHFSPPSSWTYAPDDLRDVEKQLRAYFAGELTSFEVDLDPVGTPFQLRVWEELRKIPYATTVSYADIARAIGKPAAARAVGAANGSNPIPIIVPCHRVIGSDGRLVGYRGGVDIKKRLIALELLASGRALGELSRNGR